MSDLVTYLPPEQQTIRDRCFHPSGTFVEFTKEAIEQSIPDRFEKIANQFPHRIAVQSGADVLTYAQLNLISNQIARTILSCLRSPGQPVELLFGHQPPMVAAILAVLKSANLYVPLDSSYPVDRLRYMSVHSTARLILTDTEHYALARKLAAEGMEIVNIDDLDAQICGENLNLALEPLDHAYVVYTSGSTGQPKGVLHNQLNVLYSVFVESNRMHICSDDRIGLLHSFSSSASTKYLFTALLNGASLILFDVKTEGLERLRLWLIREGVTLCDFTVSLYRSLTHSLESAGNFPSLRLILLGSEAVTQDDVALYKRFLHPESTLIILLATSETATIRSYFVNSTGDDHSDAVPVGYPIEGKSIALLDETGNPVQPGKVGEIAVKSRYLAVGYWRQPDLTRAKFLPDLNGGDERIYLTGDLGLMLPDGCLMHKGRKDFRVKIRGYGVDIAEVEKFLREHALIKDTVVVARRNEVQEARLIAYFTSLTQQVPTTSELREFLVKKLPDYMIPSAFVKLDTLPLTMNGKVDRKALPEPKTNRPALSMSYVAPRTILEETLSQIWAEILSLDHVGIHDNFFDLGGHSLAATRVISRVIQTFQLELPLKALFDSPTVAEMAMIIALNETKIAEPEALASMLNEVEAMSEDETQRLLAEESARSGRADGHE